MAALAAIAPRKEVTGSARLRAPPPHETRSTVIAGPKHAGSATAPRTVCGRRFGFTLLELLIVLTVLSLLAAVAPPLVSRALPGVELRKSARELVTALVSARSRAMTRSRSVALQLDLRDRTYRIEGSGETAELPDDIAISLYGADLEIPSEVSGGIRFFPDGSSSGGRITLERGGRAYRIDVDWLLGSITVND